MKTKLAIPWFGPPARNGDENGRKMELIFVFLAAENAILCC